MPDERFIRRLLEEMMDSQMSPEDVCRSHPEALPDLRDRWQRIAALGADVDAMFPCSVSDESAGVGSYWSTLPRISGYEIEEVLGSGGMGVVYKARHLTLGRTVAVKMLLAGPHSGPRDTECLMREAAAVAALRHPHIVQVFDVGSHEGRPYFTMEYFEGGTLARKLAGQPQSPADAAVLAATLASAVQVAHTSGIVHRDLKPGNILLTAEGSPKVADFSLARRVDGDPSATAADPRMGTPSYMAPEQVVGGMAALSPAVDIYALGAILYELLTGRPPFRAATASQTQRQVVEEDPVPPSRLNSRVPRDLETICLKCLRKDATHRYSTAGAVAEDLGRFARGEPIAARPVGRIERAAMWVHRRPAQTTAIVMAAAVALAVLAAGGWFIGARAKTARAVANDLQLVSALQAGARWEEARTALERAKGRLGAGGAAALRQSITQAEHDLALVARLDRIRLQRSVVVDGRFGRRQNAAITDRQYGSTLRETGFITDERVPPEEAAARVASSSIRVVLIEALDDWAACVVGDQDRTRRAWILNVARLADSDPGWRDRARDPDAWDDPERMSRLAGAMPDHEDSLSLQLAIAERLGALREDNIPFLRRIQQAHPADFWANFSLGLALGDKSPENALRFFQAALAIRPDAAIARTNLGVALGMVGQIDESIEQLRASVLLDPKFSSTHADLGNALWLKGLRDQAMKEYRTAVELDPNSSSARASLGKALAESGEIANALEQLRAAVKCDPESALAHDSLGLVLQMAGQLDEALQQGEEAVRRNPNSASARLNLSLTLRNLGRWDKAVDHLKKAVALSPNDAQLHSNLGTAYMALGRRDEGMNEFHEALRLNSKYAPALHGLGVAVGDAGDIDQAARLFERSLGCDPSYAVAMGALGQARLAQGRFGEAKEHLSKFLAMLGEKDSRRAIAVQLIARCDRMIQLEGREESVLEGKAQLGSATELVEFAELCRAKRRYADATRFYAQAFEADPSMAADPATPHRYNAACVAALAASQSSGPVGARARAQALQWLDADLTGWSVRLNAGDAAATQSLIGALAHWRSDPDLAGVRDPHLTELLPSQERDEWDALWRRVEELLIRAENFGK